MIISKTPFRISFFGGGTDYPIWFQEHNGAVLGTSIDKYCYIMVRQMPPYFQDKHRIVYKEEEFVNRFDKIKHPAIRECLHYMKVDSGLEIIHWADMPARKGMGSSSAFTVGLLNALHTLKGETCDRATLAQEAIDIEQNWIKENVGCQDQFLTAVGGMNFIDFGKSTSITPLLLQNNLIDYLLLFDTGFSHIASEVAGKVIQDIPDRKKVMTEMYNLTYAARNYLYSDLIRFGKALGEVWELKKAMSGAVSNKYIDGIYEKGISAGALGGKLLGAGQGGYVLFFVEPDKQDSIRKAVGLKEVNFSFENTGSQIIYSDVL